MSDATQQTSHKKLVPIFYRHKGSKWSMEVAIFDNDDDGDRNPTECYQVSPATCDIICNSNKVYISENRKTIFFRNWETGLIDSCPADPNKIKNIKNEAARDYIAKLINGDNFIVGLIKQLQNKEVNSNKGSISQWNLLKSTMVNIVRAPVIALLVRPFEILDHATQNIPVVHWGFHKLNQLMGAIGGGIGYAAGDALKILSKIPGVKAIGATITRVGQFMVDNPKIALAVGVGAVLCFGFPPLGFAGIAGGAIGSAIISAGPAILGVLTSAWAPMAAGLGIPSGFLLGMVPIIAKVAAVLSGVLLVKGMHKARGNTCGESFKTVINDVATAKEKILTNARLAHSDKAKQERTTIQAKRNKDAGHARELKRKKTEKAVKKQAKAIKQLEKARRERLMSHRHKGSQKHFGRQQVTIRLQRRHSTGARVTHGNPGPKNPQSPTNQNN